MHRQIHCKKLIWYKADRNLLIAQEKKCINLLGASLCKFPGHLMIHEILLVILY